MWHIPDGGYQILRGCDEKNYMEIVKEIRTLQELLLLIWFERGDEYMVFSKI